MRMSVWYINFSRWCVRYGDEMEYVARLLHQEQYRKTVKKIARLEADRIYCRHNMEHFMDVARLAQIRNLKEQLGLDEEMIYLYALLHDIGRMKECEQGISHAAASAEFAGEIFATIDYPKEKGDIICQAILAHRRETCGELYGEKLWQTAFTQLMKWADKASRMCFACEAADSCKWSEEEKNKPETWF